MTDADLNRIETTIGITLPKAYRDFALTLPESPDDEDAYKWYPFIDVDEIIDRNKDFRSGDRVDGWKPELLCIGTFEGGDFFIDTTDIDKGIFVEHSNSGSDQLGGQYTPDDYSSCRVSSWSEFINR
jgi:hypothetical protein